jgi:asparagine synthase (glutamine-hydrolysing)
MCGIIGILHPQSQDYIVSATQAIAHRGPDGHDIFQYKNLALGHRRLAIVDLSDNGLQPMKSADGRYIIVFNGEIYNHQEFRPALEKKYTFKSSSDTETLLYGIIEYGTSFLSKINGIFAFSFLDTETDQLLIVRDQFGIKPLYIYKHEGVLMFGSEIKSFLSLPELNKTVDFDALKNYLFFLWSPNEQTPFKYVQKLNAGHFVQCNINDVEATWKENKYYEVPFEGQYYNQHTEEELIELLEQKLLKAVERQLMSDVPVGFFLSGGLDSSAVVAMAKKLRPNEKLKCYTIKNNQEALTSEGFSDDLQYARVVAKHLDCDLVEIEANIEIMEDFDKMIYHLDEPQSDVAPLNVALICKQARKDGYKVLLGGTAGDDLFSGYRRHQALKMEPYFRLIPSFISKSILGFLRKMDAKRPIVRRMRKLLRDSSLSSFDRRFGYFSWMPIDRVISLFKTSIQDYQEPSTTFEKLLANIPEEKNALNQMLYWELRTFLPHQNLNYTDKISMAEGVEVRVPFLDLDLLDFSCKIPPKLKMKGVTTKYILKKMMEKYLPKEVIYRPKAGFGGPLRYWITNDLQGKINDFLSKESIEKRGIFSFEAVHQLIEEDKSGKEDFSYNILSLLAIEAWFRKFID